MSDKSNSPACQQRSVAPIDSSRNLRLDSYTLRAAVFSASDILVPTSVTRTKML